MKWIGMVEMIAGCVFVVSLLFMASVNICIDARVNKAEGVKPTKYVWWKWLLLIPLVRNDGNAGVPIWIAYPITLFGVLLGALLIIGILWAIISSLG